MKLEDIKPFKVIITDGETTEEVEFAPVKHGKWIVIPQRCENQTFDECKCSVCGVVEYFNAGWEKFNYCPSCGAMMDKEKDDETN